jgi:hypothetical protein
MADGGWPAGAGEGLSLQNEMLVSFIYVSVLLMCGVL